MMVAPTRAVFPLGSNGLVDDLLPWNYAAKE